MYNELFVSPFIRRGVRKKTTWVMQLFVAQNAVWMCSGSILQTYRETFLIPPRSRKRVSKFYIAFFDDIGTRLREPRVLDFLADAHVEQWNYLWPNTSWLKKKIGWNSNILEVWSKLQKIIRNNFGNWFLVSLKLDWFSFLNFEKNCTYRPGNNSKDLEKWSQNMENWDDVW